MMMVTQVRKYEQAVNITLIGSLNQAAAYAIMVKSNLSIEVFMADLKPSTLDVINKLGDYKHAFGLLLSGRQTVTHIERKIEEVLDAALDLRSYPGEKNAFLENMEFRFKGIALELMRNVTPFLHQKGLLAKAYQVMPDPTAFSFLLQRAYLSSESKSLLRCAEEALSLGGVMTSEDMMSVHNLLRNVGRDEYEAFKVNPDLALRLMENMSKSSWVMALEREDTQWVWNKFVFESLCNLANQGHYKKVIDHILSNEGVYKEVKGDRHAFMVQLSLGVSDVRFFSYLAAQDKSEYDKVINKGFIHSNFQHLISISPNEFDVGKLPDMAPFSEKFFINSFVEGVLRHNLSEREYKGLQRHWKALGYGNGKSLAEVASKHKDLKSKVEAHQRAVLALDEKNKDSRMFLEPSSQFYAYARGSYQLIEKLYFKPEDRVHGNPDRERALFKSILSIADRDCYDFVDRHRSFLQDPGVIDLLVALKEKAGNRFRRDKIHDFADYAISLMLHDDPAGKAIRHVSKKVFEDFINGRDSIADEQIRNINWECSAIKRAFLENDMEL